jgi:hypothetical protein
MHEVTFAQFAKLAQQRHWTVESLTARFKVKIEEPREFFTRVLKGSNGGSALPYRSVIDFYNEAQSVRRALPSGHNLCACGCKQEVFDRQKWALPGCRKWVARQKVSDKQISPG